MKKTSKLLGTVALTAALALGTTVPAFAEVNDAEHAEMEDARFHEAASVTDPTTAAPNDTDATNTGTSKIQIAAEVGQLNAVIPLKAKIVASTLGGKVQHVPSYDVAANATWNASAGTHSYTNCYRIENHSPNIDIRVVSIKAEVKNNGRWGYATEPQSNTSTIAAQKSGMINLNINGQNIDNSTSMSLTDNKWKINKINTGNQSTQSALGLNLSESTTSVLKGDFVNGVYTTQNTNTPNPSAVLTADDEVTLTYKVQIA